MDEFLRHKLPKMTEEKTENLSKSIKSKRIKLLIKKKKKKLSGKKSSGLHEFSDEFYQMFKELIPILLKIFRKIKKRGYFPAYSMKLLLL